MKQEQQAVHFYGLSLLRGCSHGLSPTPGRTLRLEDGAGAYITAVFDTGAENSTFHRLVVDGDFSGVKLEVIVAAANREEAVIDDAPVELSRWMSDPQVPHRRKAEALQSLCHKRMVNTRDMLLHEVKGRYLWIYAAVYATGEGGCELRGMRLELPRVSFTRYFPEIYQGNDFFDRWVGIFQSMLTDIERRVDRIPAMLDYRTTADENVGILAGWLGIDNSRGLFSPRQLRHMIRHIDLYQGAKGTKGALEQMLELLTGIRPRIVEHFQWLRPGGSPQQREQNRRLYGETANHFCVIFDLTERALPGHVTERDVQALIESHCPMGAEFRVVYLRPCSYTDTHCYLDINSALSVPEVASIDGSAFGSHITVQ